MTLIALITVTVVYTKSYEVRYFELFSDRNLEQSDFEKKVPNHGQLVHDRQSNNLVN